jgi:hypothetical protein
MTAFSKCSVWIYKPPVANSYFGKCLTDHSLSIFKCTEKGTCTSSTEGKRASKTPYKIQLI